MGPVARRTVRARASLSANADPADVARRVRDLENEQGPFASGRLLEYTVSGAGNVTVPHGLGRDIQGWIVVDVTTAVHIYRTTSANDSVNFTLNFSGATTAKVWVY